MKYWLSVVSFMFCAAVSRADDAVAPAVAPPAAPEAASAAAPARPRGVAPGLAAAQLNASAASGPDGGRAGDAAAPAVFVSEEKWGLAGYNNNEPIYTILVTSHDARILRCTADLKGSYFEKGEKQSITDRQTMTIFPSQQVQMGNWSGMDQQSGATYAVKCHPV